MKPTLQQETIIAEAKARRNIAIEAKAGAAKTTTCVMIANEVVKPSLYIAFNKDIAEEAKSKFPTHVTCQTIHSLAYREIVKFPKSAYGKRLQASLDLLDILDFLSDKEDIEDALFVRTVMVAFFQSSEVDIAKFVYDHLTLNTVVKFTEEEIGYFQKVCIDYWLDLTSPTGSSKLSHDVYLKMFQLSEPVLMFEVIYLDEFQDTNPVCLDILLRQTHAQKIVVGDPHQSIYAFRGAVNAFNYIPKDFTKLSLSESFRFTPEVADIARKCLELKQDVAIGSIVGLANKGVVTDKAIVCRTNIGVLKEITALGKQGYKVETNINLKEAFAKLFHIEALSFGKTPKFPVKDLSVFHSWKDFYEATQEDTELKILLDLYNFVKGSGSVFSFKKDFESYIVPKGGECFISTCHKVKGLEFSSVKLSEDFCKLKEDEGVEEWVEKLEEQEINLLYIGITRGKYEVELPWVIREAMGVKIF